MGVGPSSGSQVVLGEVLSCERRRAVFFDRDGTLMEEVHYCAKPAQVQAIPGAAEALMRLRNQGWLAILITNQSGIGRGYFSVEQYQAVHSELMDQLQHQIDAAYFCPDAPENASERRKPGIGMVEEAVRDWNIDLAGSYFVGDRMVDIECGRRAGLQTILVQTGYWKKEAEACPADAVVRDVVEAIAMILANGSGYVGTRAMVL